MNRRQALIIANRYRILQQREERQNKKYFEKVFKDFAYDIEQQLSKDDWLSLDYTILIKELKRSLSSVFTRSSKKSIEWVKTLFGWNLKDSDIKAITDKALNNYNKKYAATKVKEIESATRRIINEIISEGQSEGLTSSQIKDNIVSRVNGMAEGRAMNISRTETLNAINNTTHNTAEYAGMTKKTWIHSGGGKEDRESHLALDGKTIGMKEYFVVDGYNALYPHDPNLPAGQVINCHCICIYE